ALAASFKRSGLMSCRSGYESISIALSSSAAASNTRRQFGGESRTEVVNAATRMPQDLNHWVSYSSQIPFRLIFFSPERGMKTTQHDVELRHCLRLHVAVSCRIKVHFNGSQDAKRPGSRCHAAVDLLDLLDLALQLLFIDAACYFEALGVVSNSNVTVSILGCCFCHFRDGCAAVTPERVHLQIALHTASPRGILLQN